MANPNLVPTPGIDSLGRPYTRDRLPEKGAPAGSLGWSAAWSGAKGLPVPAIEDAGDDSEEEERSEGRHLYETHRDHIRGCTFDLASIDRSDRLSPEQVQTLVEGKNIFEDGNWEDLIGAMDEQAYEQAGNGLKGMLTEEEVDILRDEDLFDELRQEVLEKDNSNWIADIRRNTPSMLFRYDVGLEFEAAIPNLNDTDQEVERRARQVAERLGADYQDPKAAESCRELVEQSLYSGGKLEVIWYGDVDEAIDLSLGLSPEEQGSGDDPADHKEVGALSVGKAHILIRNAGSGSGGEVELEKVSMPWVTGRVSTDVAGDGYSWTDTAGPYEPAYRSDIVTTKH